MKRIGVDVGGTFTDFIFVDEEKGNVAVYKTPSTPKDPSIGVMNGVRELCTQTGSPLESIDSAEAAPPLSAASVKPPV